MQKTLGIVPVGLTKFRENCYPLKTFDAQGATKSSSKYAIGKKKCANKQVRILFI